MAQTKPSFILSHSIGILIGWPVRLTARLFTFSPCKKINLKSLMKMRKKRKLELLPKTRNTRKYFISYLNLLIRLAFMGGLGINFFKSEWSYA